MQQRYYYTFCLYFNIKLNGTNSLFIPYIIYVFKYFFLKKDRCYIVTIIYYDYDLPL